MAARTGRVVALNGNVVTANGRTTNKTAPASRLQVLEAKTSFVSDELVALVRDGVATRKELAHFVVGIAVRLLQDSDSLPSVEIEAEIADSAHIWTGRLAAVRSQR
jgi:hypothetical protein